MFDLKIGFNGWFEVKFRDEFQVSDIIQNFDHVQLLINPIFCSGIKLRHLIFHRFQKPKKLVVDQLTPQFKFLIRR